MDVRSFFTTLRQREQRLQVYVDARFSVGYGMSIHDGNASQSVGGRVPLPGVTATLVEAKALHRALEWLIKHDYADRPITVYTDCRRVVDMLEGRRPAGGKWLKGALKQLDAERGAFADLEIIWIPGHENGEAHKVARQKASKGKIWAPSMNEG